MRERFSRILPEASYCAKLSTGVLCRVRREAVAVVARRIMGAERPIKIVKPGAYWFGVVLTNEDCGHRNFVVVYVSTVRGQKLECCLNFLWCVEAVRLSGWFALPRLAWDATVIGVKKQKRRGRENMKYTWQSLRKCVAIAWLLVGLFALLALPAECLSAESLKRVSF